MIFGKEKATLGSLSLPPPIEFNEKLWHAVVDRVTVYNDDRLVFTFRNGSEETVMM